MARLPRIVVEKGEGWYHLYCKTGGKKKEYPLHQEGVSETFIGLLRHYAGGYSCDLAAFCVMGNHYHLVRV